MATRLTSTQKTASSNLACGTRRAGLVVIGFQPLHWRSLTVTPAQKTVARRRGVRQLPSPSSWTVRVQVPPTLRRPYRSGAHADCPRRCPWPPAGPGGRLLKARSSSGQGRQTFNLKIAGSNPVRATAPPLKPPSEGRCLNLVVPAWCDSAGLLQSEKLRVPVRLRAAPPLGLWCNG